jgi:hypothetical protein
MTKLRLEPDPHDTGTTAAEEAVSAFEAVPDGAAYASQAGAATEAVGTLRAGATASLFPALSPATADTIALFNFAVETFSRHAFGAQLAVLHQQAIEAAPELAALLRSGPALARVRGMAAAVAPAGGELFAAAERDAVESYMQVIAGQLVGRPEFEPAATILSQTVPELEARVGACRQRHQAYVASELGRIENETRQAAEVIKADELQQREELARYFAAQHGRPFVVRGNIVSGQALAALVKHQGARDHSGEFVTFALADLLEARARQMAADAAVAAGGVQ